MKTRKEFVCRACQSTGGTSHAGLCLKCYNREYYKVNRDKIIKKTREWGEKNIDRKRELSRKYAKRRWQLLSPEQKKEQSRLNESRRSEEQKRKRAIKRLEYYHKNKKIIVEKSKKYGVVCSGCGEIKNGSVYTKGLCKSCYSKKAYKEKNVRVDKFCEKCFKNLSKYAISSLCKACRNKEKYKNNPEYREKIISRNSLNSKKESYKENKRIAVIRRRVKEKEAPNTLTKNEWVEILEKYNYKCAYCGEKNKLEVDHIIPVSKGGGTTKENVVPACRSCNSRKGNSVGLYVPKVSKES